MTPQPQDLQELHSTPGRAQRAAVHGRYWRYSALVAVLLLGPAALANEATRAPLPKSITVVLDDNYPPYIFRDDSGRLRGILRDRWSLWSQKTGVEVSLEAQDWSKAQAQMAAGKADVIDTMFKTPERLRRLDFSEPYATIEVPIYFDKAIGGITDAESLRGFTVGIKDGDACIEWLERRGVSNFRRYQSYEALVSAAGIRDVRVMCIDGPPAHYFFYKLGLEKEFRFTEPLYTGEFHWAVRKGNAAMMQLVAEGFARFTEEELKRIDNRWLGRPLGDRLAARYAGYALLVAAALALALALWSWTLRRQVAARTVELTATLQMLDSNRKHFEALVSTTPVGVFETDVNGLCVYVNDRWLEIAGMNREAALGEGWATALHPEYRQRVMMEWTAAVKEKRDFHTEHCLRRPDGKDSWVIAQATPLRNERGVITGYIGSITDISERKEAESTVRFLAHHDALTGLPNRTLARDRAEVAMAIAERSGHKVGLLFLDLDNFKMVNDSLGHSTGDVLLKSVAARLGEGVRGTDTISRQGGDEFLIVMPEVTHADALAAITGKLMEKMATPFAIEGREIASSVSVGIAVYPDDGNDFDTLLQKADTAMYHAKESGRNAYRFFTEQMNLDAVEHLNIQAGLRRALEQREFLLHFQPQIDLSSGNVVGAEALLRWNHPDLGLVPPVRFIPVAESTGMIVPIGEWVLQEACIQAASWHRAGFAGLVVAVNLSALQFRRSDLHQTVMRALDQSGLDPTCLELELTESIMIGDTELVLDVLTRLKAIGVKLSIDDFGTGYSSLSYLKRFPLDRLKIDQSFVRDMTRDTDNSAIVRAIIQLARILNLRTIAEGVEEADTVQHLRIHHCDEAQGYFFARPMPAANLLDYLVTTSGRTNLPTRA